LLIGPEIQIFEQRGGKRKEKKQKPKAPGPGKFGFADQTVPWAVPKLEFRFYGDQACTGGMVVSQKRLSRKTSPPTRGLTLREGGRGKKIPRKKAKAHHPKLFSPN